MGSIVEGESNIRPVILVLKFWSKVSCRSNWAGFYREIFIRKMNGSTLFEGKTQNISRRVWSWAWVRVFKGWTAIGWRHKSCQDRQTWIEAGGIDEQPAKNWKKHSSSSSIVLTIAFTTRWKPGLKIQKSNDLFSRNSSRWLLDMMNCTAILKYFSMVGAERDQSVRDRRARACCPSWICCVQNSCSIDSKARIY